MSDDFEFDEHGSIEFKTNRSFKNAKNDLLTEFYRQKYKSLKNQNHPIDTKKKTDLNSQFTKACEDIKREMISLDKSRDNSVVYTAMANFKKRRV
jgi:hypothetical protein